MKTGARNDIVGVVAEIKRGSLMGQAKVQVTGEVQLSSVMTLDSIDELELKPGDKVRVVVKAVNVLLLKD